MLYARFMRRKVGNQGCCRKGLLKGFFPFCLANAAASWSEVFIGLAGTVRDMLCQEAFIFTIFDLLLTIVFAPSALVRTGSFWDVYSACGLSDKVKMTAASDNSAKLISFWSP